MLPLEQARAMIESGARFGDVVHLVSDVDYEELAAWFVREPSVPNKRARLLSRLEGEQKREQEEYPLRELPKLHAKKLTTFINLQPCAACGGYDFVPGACPICSNCGQSIGGCG
jgi:hypothetical protein